MPIQSVNPASGQVVKTFTPHSDETVDEIITSSRSAFEEFRNWSYQARSESMMNAATILEEEAEDIGRVITQEMGKTFLSALAEVKKCVWLCRYYASAAEEQLANEDVEIGTNRAYRCYLPMGTILAVMPWNYPLWQVFRFAVPALMAGNTGLLKHASNVPQCAIYIEDVFRRAGFPKGVFQTLLIGGSKVERVLRNPIVRAATLTGSELAGASVASICGQEIKPTLLELGGSDAFIIMPSADILKAVETATSARVQNNGQSCIAAKRFIVHKDIYDEVRRELTLKFSNLKVGDPMSEDTDIGPIIDEKSLEQIMLQVERAVEHGANVITGAQRLNGPGFYMSPGIIENIPKSSLAYREEIFGPVAALYKVGSLDEALDLANDSPFGLGSAIFTQNLEEQQHAIRGIEAGATFVNTMTSSYPNLPFGGVKRSGYGRELSTEGIRTFCNVKTVVIA